ncbi:MAG TPA: sulfotransferase [Candidatus Binatia bacterium]|nr:sulfotransferase [Candidatus Binatia bacterium]
MLNGAKIVLEAVIGPAHARDTKWTNRRLYLDFGERLNDLLMRSPRTEYFSDERPIFLFASGWRSGSTLLQRMLMHHDEGLLIWGEPFAHCNLIDTLMAQIRAFTPNYPNKRWFPEDVGLNDLSRKWVANLYPPLEYFCESHAVFLKTMFEKPALMMGKNRWGIKEVRFGKDHAFYLKWLFPRSYFIFIVRNPVDAYASYRRFRNWYRYWPEHIVMTPRQFGRHWRLLTEEFLNNKDKLGAIFLRYEDLSRSETIRQLSDFIGQKIGTPEEVGMVSGPKGEEWEDIRKIPWVEEFILRRTIGKALQAAGYS